MPAPFGNTNGTALKDPEERQKAFKSFCQHIAEGYPTQAWSYRNGEYRCCWATILSYLEKNPVEFDTFLKQEAHSCSYKKWFDRGIKLTDGEVKGNPSPQTWATIMRNMFGWDKDKKDEGALEKAANELSRIREFLAPHPSHKSSKDKEAKEDHSDLGDLA